MAIIEVDQLTKEYRLGQILGAKQGLQNLLARVQGKPVVKRERFKALEDISFSVEPGEVVGIIGHNGAGKSTLLKMLARVSVPTTGSVKVTGRVAPLIEVGAGLVPDMTGRENIFLNGTLLGMRRAELEKKFDEIVAFAELEEFIDTPMKRYSSGMRVRLGFAIATSVDSEVLIVDEVLAVGDLAFQRKCFDRLEKLIKKMGKTVLVVSHNIRQIERLCSRAILLDKGRLVADGIPSELAEMFYKQSNEIIQSYQSNVLKANVRASGEVDLLNIDIIDENGNVINEIDSGAPLRIAVRVKVNAKLVNPEVIVGTHSTDFIYLTASSTARFHQRPNFDVGEHMLEYFIPSFPMVNGTYCVRVVIFDSNRRLVFSGETLKTFNVSHMPGEVKEPPNRILNLPAEFRVNGVSILDVDNKEVDGAYV